ncbi:MAG TPA: hypothetical protein VJU87_04375 [Gemmatimonadaceae bacterium]|nr:hypothetical protein [Gemmatimonadaceae bacterium]
MRGRRAYGAAAPVTAGFLGGLIVGLLAWSTQLRRCRRDLFSRRPIRRLAALGYLGGRPSVETARLLVEYVGWERHPTLRRRGERMLRRMRTYLE